MTPRRLAAYYRVSTRAQAGERNVSLDVQRERVLDYCERGGYVLAGEFKDILSGTRDSRREYQRMLAACAAGGVDEVVTMFLDRFGRNTEEILYRVLQLKRELGVSVRCTDEDIAEIIPLFFSSWKAGEESKRTAERTRPAQVEAAKRGRAMGMRPFGWTKTAGLRLEVFEPEAALVRRIARMYACDQIPIWRIALTLNDEDIHAPRGGRWDGTMVRSVLGRERNGGTVQYGRPGTKANPDGSRETVVQECPPILSPELFAAVQERMAAMPRFPSGKSQRSDFLLAGLAWCGVCDCRLSGSDRDPTSRYPRYRCAGTNRGKGRCPGMSYIPARKLEQAIIDLLVSLADAEAAAAAAVPPSEPARNWVEDERAARRELERLNREIELQYELHRDGVLDRDGLKLVSVRVAASRKAAESRLATIAAERAAESRRAARITALPGRARSLAEAVRDAPRERVKALLQELVARIVVHADGRFDVEFRH